MVDFHVREHAVPLEDPVDLFLLAPHDVPIVVPCLLPLPALHGVQHAIFERGLEFDVRGASRYTYGPVG